MSTFGTYRGNKMYLMHIQSRLTDNAYALPFICHMKTPIPGHYNDFLSRKVKDGYQTNYLLLLCQGEDKVWVRIPGTNRYTPQNHFIVNILDNFKRVCRLRLALNRIRQRRRSSIIKEELIMRAYHPDRIQRWLDMGFDLDEICEL